MRSWGILGLIAFFVVLSAGCRHRYDPVYNSRRVERFERRLIEVSARDSGCSPVAVSPMRVGELVWIVNTCTGPREYFLDCNNRGRRWANCRWDRIYTVPETAARMFNCPPQSIAQQPGPGPMTRIAQGCGMSVQMSLRCNEVGCGWMPDGPPQGAAVQAAPPPPPGYTPRVIVIQPPPQ